MEKTPKLFPAQEPSERVLVVVRRHWFTYVLFWVIAIFMVLPLVVGIYALYVNAINLSDNQVSLSILVGSIYSLLILGLLLYGFIDFYLDIYILTDRRIVDIKQNGFFNRSISELNLRQVQDVKASVKGVFPTLIHYGDVFIQTAGERENFYFKDIPHPYRVSKLILDLHESALKKRNRSEGLNSNDFDEPTNLHESMKDFNEGVKYTSKKSLMEDKKDITASSSKGSFESNESSIQTKPTENAQELKEGEATKL